MKIGFVSMPFVGHLNPMTTLARRLQSRGHEVAFIGVPDVEPFARAAGLNFVPFCKNEYPAGSIAKLLRPVSKLHGLEAARWSVRERGVDLFKAASTHRFLHQTTRLLQLSHFQLPFAMSLNSLPTIGFSSGVMRHW
jgi:zeaxanthin glucosyltransferase